MADSEEKKHCSNCKRDIAAANFVMHEVHCRRNIVLCKHCDEPVPRSEVDDHYEEYHIEVACDVCNASVEKQKIDDHKEECPKRPARCVYCELDLPFCDLKEHLNYCGTRTEPCVKCGQYVMQKDLQKHEDSDCSYPQPKATNEQNATAINNSSIQASSSSRQNDFRSRLLPEEYYNNFAMGELERICISERMPGVSSTRNGVSRLSNPRAVNTRQPARSQTTNPGVTGTKRTNVKKTNNTPERNSNINQSDRSDVPRNRTGPIHQSSELQSVQDDLDQLLAMNLAHDLSDDYFPAIANTNDNTGLVNLDRSDSEEPAANQITLPCEFCDELFPIDSLLQHQSSCLPGVGSEGIPIPNLNLNPEPEIDSLDLPNNSPRRSIPPPEDRPPGPPVVDNLAHQAAQDWLANPSGEFADDILLPCEFCDVLFPEDLLIQHQAVCDSNRAGTPLAVSPPARPRASNTQRFPPEPHLSAAGRNRVAKRQNDPSFSFMNNRGDEYNGAASKPNQIYKPKISKKKNTNIRNYGSVSDSGNGGISGRSGAGRNGAMNSRGRKNVNAEQPDTEGDSMPAQRRKGSANRVRETLDHLVDDPTADTRGRPWSSSTFTLDKEEKSTNNRKVQQREQDDAGTRLAPRHGSSWNEPNARSTSYEPSFATGGASSGTKSQSYSKPKPVTRRNFEPDFQSTRANPTRTRPTGGASSSNRNNPRKPGPKSKRPPQGDV